MGRQDARSIPVSLLAHGSAFHEPKPGWRVLPFRARPTCAGHPALLFAADLSARAGRRATFDESGSFSRVQHLDLAVQATEHRPSRTCVARLANGAAYPAQRLVRS